MRKTVLVSVLAIAALLSWAPGAGACPGAKRPAGGESADQARLAIRCLINDFRRSRHLHGVRGNTPLQIAAQEHSDAMNAGNFFAHDGDGTLSSRTRGAGFRGWGVGEVLAFGMGPLGSPKATVRAWLHSAEHREILLMRRWRQIGVGISPGSPFGPDGPSEATYTADLGS
jgi:uncharacterized protein YkwD